MPHDEPTARSPLETGPSVVPGSPAVGPDDTDATAPLRLRLDISYQGTDFVGWAEQPGRRTVAGVLQDALGTLLRAPVRLVVAGRTDSGVHAIGQVAHLDADPAALLALTPRDQIPAHPTVALPPRDQIPAHPTVALTPRDQVPAVHLTGALIGLIRRLAGLLPGDVRVRAATPAPDGFDARFSALRRHYRYRIGTAEWGVEPADRPFVLALRRALDVQAMTAAGERLLGLHDFAAYCKPRDGATTIRELQALTVRPAPGDPTEVVVQVAADAFCHSMVRSLVGALLAVGLGRDDVDGPRRRLAAANRAAFPVAAAHGLTLVGVDYPAVPELSARSEQTRAMRVPGPLGTYDTHGTHGPDRPGAAGRNDHQAPGHPTG